MQEDELREKIEGFYVKIRAGRDPKTGELHLEPTDFYDQMLTLIKQYSKDYAQEQQKALIDRIEKEVIGDLDSMPKRGDIDPDIYVEVIHRTEGRISLRHEQRTKLNQIKDSI